MTIPYYPEFTPMVRELKSEMHPRLSLTPDGVSEYTFSNLYLFRNRYNYKVSRTPEETLVISGERDGKRFFMTPCASPGRYVLEDIFRTHDYWKGISESLVRSGRADWEAWGLEIAEDRDNFDYLYLRTDLAELAGKKYHKKRNLVHAFTNAFSHSEAPLSAERIPDAMAVLERWREDKGEDGDYAAAREALELFGTLKMKGVIYYVDGKAAGWCLGESLARGRMFAIHFEKAIDGYKGIYQFMNQAFAARLPAYYRYINREQDLGDEGLRQAKMTYRPAGFVRKYIGKKTG
jgi:hypothetical protein